MVFNLMGKHGTENTTQNINPTIMKLNTTQMQLKRNKEENNN